MVVAEIILLATLYSHNLTGRPMANGQPYHPDRPAVALNLLPLGSPVLICNSTKCIRATVTDRIAPRFAKRRVDLSDEVARRLGGRMPQRVVIYP